MFNVKDLSAMQVGLASPDRIREWSHGEVTRPETINYRSQKPEMEGLFCEKIFGPSKDFECHCGKYKKIRYQGLVCEKCGVEVISKQVRRERMGHIELATPCTHIWYLKGVPSRIQLLLSTYADISVKELEEVVYFAAHICLNPGSAKSLKKGQYLDEATARIVFSDVINEIKNKFDAGSSDSEKVELYLAHMAKRDETFDYFTIAKFISKHTGAEFGEGADAVKRLLRELDIEKEFKKAQAELKDAQGPRRIKLTKRLEVLEAFRTSDNKPEWMVLDVIPVIPPDLRPMLQLDGGRFAASDLNDLYRRVITRNNRLRKLVDMNAPYVILMNEKRMLQEAVDALIDNGRRNNKPVLSTAGRPLKSLTAALKGKQGRFRQNLLGKRVDYSGRSVIAVGPDLRMYQCGLPREMAIQLLRPFIASILIKDYGVLAHKEADKMIDRKDPVVYDIVEDIIEEHPVLLNRAPTLHRLGIQAFQPKLVDGRAIRLHPLVCTGFNADFDGDQMAVHVPLGKAAQEEALNLMLASNNILGPKDGKPIVTPSQDMVLGNYYLTLEETAESFLERAKKAHEEKDYDAEEQYKLFAASEGKVFSSVEDVLRAYETKQISLHNRVAIIAKALKKDNTVFTEEMQNMYLLTSVGRIIFNLIFPSNFPYLNDATDDSLKINLGKDDDANRARLKVLKKHFVARGTNVKEVIEKMPLRAPLKKKNLGKIIDQVFHRYDTMNTSVILDKLKDQGFKYSTVSGVTVSLNDIRTLEGKEELIAKGDKQIAQIEKLYAKGLLTDSERHNKIIEVWTKVKDEVIAKLDKQLKEDDKNPLFIMVDSGARGSLGNFAQLEGMRGLMNKPNGETIELPIKSSFREGMTVSEFFIATHGARKGGADTALKTADSGYLTRRLVDVSQDVIVREEDCGTDHGFVMRAIKNPGEEKPLVSLYDRIRGRYAMHDIKNPKTGEVIAEANTLISNTKAHLIEDSGIEEVEIRSLFGCQTKDGVCAHCYGRNLATGNLVQIGEAVGIMAAQSIGEPGTQLTMRTFHSGGVAESDITQGLPRVQELVEARHPKGEALISDIKGKITRIEEENGCYLIDVTNDIETKTYTTTFGARLAVKKGQSVNNGERLTTGAISPKKLLDASDVTTVENYMLDEIHKPYCAQGIEINDKHLEVIVRQMLCKVLVVDGGETDLLPGTRVDVHRYTEANAKALVAGKRPAVARPLMLGITKAALETPSFLSAASFQETPRVLTDAAIKGKVDPLHGLKENVITGKLIPAGRGLKSEEEEENIIDNFSVKAKMDEVSAHYIGVHDYNEEKK
ncbi:MAG: DNA-directed RNA polymerase subunit beta' [Bacilli bacterium]|nr:DNA-directed RNA polymerase subunit beta' [Bacilli bacterium]